MFSATDRYLARLIALPLFSTLIISAMLLVLDKMLRLFDFVATEGERRPADVGQFASGIPVIRHPHRVDAWHTHGVSAHRSLF
jgi:hypothetical protein